MSFSAEELNQDRRVEPSDRIIELPAIPWAAAIFSIIVQQGAFISSPVISNLVGDPGATDTQANVFNTLAIALNILLLLGLCVPRYQRLIVLSHDNIAAVVLLLFIFLSTTWSIHPDITIRRSVNYFSTILTAFYLVERFSFNQIMKVFSTAIAVSAIGSILFVLVFPAEAIHAASAQFENVAGAWRGVFAHKNALGHTMALGTLIELFILITGRGPLFSHTLMLCVCLALVFLSRSGTAIILSSFYLAGASLLALLLHLRRYFILGLVSIIVFATLMATTYWLEPETVWEMLGRDATLTGRTELWAIVVGLIGERPLLGWGYSALWLPQEPIASAVSEYLGWTVPHAHNALLEVTLELGLVGLAVLLVFISISLWRSVRCIMSGQSSELGFLSLVFYLSMIISGTTEATLAQNQTIEWVAFNVLSFSCGLEIRRHLRTREMPFSG
jgi:exopolysaccharide production protein ExoQ